MIICFFNFRRTFLRFVRLALLFSSFQPYFSGICSARSDVSFISAVFFRHLFGLICCFLHFSRFFSDFVRPNFNHPSFKPFSHQICTAKFQSFFIQAVFPPNLYGQISIILHSSRFPTKFVRPNFNHSSFKPKIIPKINRDKFSLNN